MESSSNSDLPNTSKSSVTDTADPGAATSNSSLQTKTVNEVPPKSDSTVNNVANPENADVDPVSSKLDATVKTEKADEKDDSVSVGSQLPSTQNTIAKEVAAGIVKNTIRKAIKEIITKERFPPPSTRLQRIAEPSMTSYVNLYNNYRNVLHPEKVLRLEEKMSDMRKYSQMIRDDLKILIVDKKNGITQRQAELLQMKIMECLDNYINTNPEKIPRFLDTSYTFRCIKVVCADEFTLKWLKKIIVNLSPPPWKGARLEVTLMSSYSMLSTMSRKQSSYKPKPKEGQVKFTIPTTTKMEFPEVAKRIGMCNPPIKTDSWKKLKEEKIKNGTVYYVSMSNDCIDEIRKKGNRLFYLLGSIKITTLNENEVIDGGELDKKKNASKITQPKRTSSKTSVLSATSHQPTVDNKASIAT